ncbi:MAG: lectin-like domain-containing protein [Breznakia sp.]
MKLLQDRKPYKVWVFLMTLSMMVSVFCANNIIKAVGIDENVFIVTSVDYQDNEAIISFDIESVDQTRYDLESIVAQKDGVIVYEKDEAKAFSLTYTASENATYNFCVQYWLKDENYGKATQAIQNRDVAVVVDGLNNQLKQSSVIPALTTSHEKVRQAATQVSDANYNPNRIDLRSLYNFSGIKGKTTGEQEAISQMEKNEFAQNYSEAGVVHANGITVGNRAKYDEGWDQQLIALTSKTQLDYNRSFVLEGRVRINSQADGFAIAMHHDDDYEARVKGGSLGVYYADNINDAFHSSERNGLANAVVFELDTRYNKGYADELDSWGGVQHHMCINSTDAQGKAESLSATDYWGVNNESGNFIRHPFDKMATYRINWDREANKITFFVDWNGKTMDYQYLISTTLSDVIARGFTTNKGYYTITSAINYRDTAGSNPEKRENDIWIDNFSYTDEDPSLDTTYTTFASQDAQISDNYAIGGEEVLITHTIKNQMDKNYEIQDVQLNLEPFLLNELKREDIKIINEKTGGIKVGTDLDNLQVLTDGVNAEKEMFVKYPAHSGLYYVQYKIRIPSLSNDGETELFNLEHKLGTKGMTQESSENAALDLRNRPALFSKTNDGTKTLHYDVVHLNDKSTDTDALLSAFANALYGKTAVGSEQSLSSKITKVGLATDTEYVVVKDDLLMHYTYETNSPSNVSLGLADTVDHTKIYTLHIRVKEKNDARLYNEYKRHIIIADEVKQSSNNYVAVDNKNPQTILETILNTWNVASFSQEMMDIYNARAFHIDENSGILSIKNISLDTSDWVNSKGFIDKNPGEYMLAMHMENDPTLGVNTNVIISENTWDYRNRNGEEMPVANGQYGYIIIPKYIALKDDLNTKNKIIANEVIEFLNYSSDKTYRITTNETFTLSSVATSDKINVVTSALGATTSDNKIVLGEIGNKSGVEDVLSFSLTANVDSDKKQHGWSGTMRFIFELIP